MNAVRNLEKRNLRNFFIFLLFIYLIFLTKDYGISYDEFWYRDVGFSVLNFIGESFFYEKLTEIKDAKNLNYMSLKEVLERAPIGFKIQHTVYSAIEYIFFSTSDKFTVFLFRHYLNIGMSCLMFIIFYKILRLRFNKVLSALGMLMLIISPKIFSDFYFNPNDIWALFSASLITYFSLYFFKKDKNKYLYFLAIALALGMNTRLILVYLYGIFILLYLLKINFVISFQTIKKILLQFFIFTSTLYIISPEAWLDLSSIFHTFLHQLSFPSDPFVYFMGEYKRSSDLPYYYIFLWIFISTPTFYLISFFVGLVIFIKKMYGDLFNKKIFDASFIFLYLAIPCFAVIIFKPNLFNGWRHFYFLYLAIIYFSIYSFDFFLSFIKNKKIFKYSFLLIIIYIGFLSIWMIKNHPYQHVYFNYYGKKYFDKFELDYWGLSNLEALKYLADLSENSEKKFKVKGIGDSRIIYAYKVLDKELKDKIIITKRDEKLDSDYYITNLHDGKNKNFYLERGFEIIKEIKVDEYAINLVMKKE